VFDKLWGKYKIIAIRYINECVRKTSSEFREKKANIDLTCRNMNYDLIDTLIWRHIED
jgi:hypothetical protein